MAAFVTISRLAEHGGVCYNKLAAPAFVYKVDLNYEKEQTSENKGTGGTI